MVYRILEIASALLIACLVALLHAYYLNHTHP
jgi:hypothetical protein